MSTELPPANSEDGGAALFERSRPRLWGVAYRSLSSVSEADDVVQDAWLRWNGTDQQAIVNPDAWLTAVTARLAIDRLRSRARERDRYLGPWLPAPVDTAVGSLAVDIADPVRVDESVVDAAELAQDVTLGLLVVLERLDPVERVVLVLADVFRESFRSIADIVGKDEAACRQIAVRARRRVLDERRHRHFPTPEERAQIAAAFMVAASTGDVEKLIELFAADAVLLSDGGPHRRAARRPVVTPSRIARFLINVVQRLPDTCTLRGAELNGEQGFVWEFATRKGVLVDGAIVLAIDHDHVTGIYVQVNREKLQHLVVT